jgi:hypothetical protein
MEFVFKESVFVDKDTLVHIVIQFLKSFIKKDLHDFNSKLLVP